jgi:hypothetical protein
MKDPLSIPWIFSNYSEVPEDLILGTVRGVFAVEPRIFYLSNDVVKNVRDTFFIREPGGGENDGEITNPYEGESDVLMNMPFESVLLEAGGGLVQLSTDCSLIHTAWSKDKDVGQGMVNHEFGSIAIRELAPGNYLGFGILMGQVEHPEDVKRLKNVKRNGVKLLFQDNLFFAAMPLIDPEEYGDSGCEDLPSECRLFTRAFFDKLKTSYAVGKEYSPQRLRVGSGKDRKLLRVKNILHVAMKKERRSYAKSIGKEINWSHRWEVMGHWRKVATVGKDRRGNYTVKGFTWVEPHEKGAKNKPVIKKVRVVHDR